MSQAGFDVIVIGAGSTGAVVASRLSDDPRCEVLLLEAGRDFPDEKSNPPALFILGPWVPTQGVGAGPPAPEFGWGFETEVLPNGHRLPLPRGKLVGGTSMINGCICVRARPSDLERWEAAGAAGWSWQDVLPFYEVVEREVPIQRYPKAQWAPTVQLIANGFVEMGYRWVDDLNRPDAWDGVVGPTPQNRLNSIRQGTLVTYVRRARGRANFTLRDRVNVDKVILEGNRAVGVEYINSDGRREQARSEKVVVSAGAYASGPILLRSGIGPAPELSRLGIDVVEDLPVGRRLMEHHSVTLNMRVPRDFARVMGPALPAVVRARNWFLVPMPIQDETGTWGIFFARASVNGEGTLAIASTQPDIAPIVDHRYAEVMATGDFDEAWKIFEELLATPALREHGVTDGNDGLSIREILSVRVRGAGHGAGGCGIGSVVDADLRVYGVECLYVADASVFPLNVTNNPNLTCMMIGERLARKLMYGLQTTSPVTRRAL